MKKYIRPLAPYWKAVMALASTLATGITAWAADLPPEWSVPVSSLVAAALVWLTRNGPMPEPPAAGAMRRDRGGVDVVTVLVVIVLCLGIVFLWRQVA